MHLIVKNYISQANVCYVAHWSVTDQEASPVVLYVRLLLNVVAARRDHHHVLV